MRKIAFSGLKGRKKDTFILSFVVVLAFLFIIIATILYSSSEATKETQRLETYGNWEYGHFDGTYEAKEKLLKNDSISKLGANRILGTNEKLGVIGTFDQEFKEMATFDLYKGKMPEKDNEIAIELGQLSNFPGPVDIGDEILVTTNIVLEERDESQARSEQKERFREVLDKVIENIDMTYKIWGMELGEHLKRAEIEFERWKNMNPGFDEEFDENEQIESLLYHSMINTNTRRAMDLEVFDEVKVELRTTYLYAFLPSEDIPEESTTEVIEKKGSVIKKEFVLQRYMVVSGILNTYSDIWDLGDNIVANSYITENAGRSFMENGFYKNSHEDVSDFKTAYNYFVKTNLNKEEFIEENQDGLEFRQNKLAYPDVEGSTESTLTYGILAFIFIATIMAIFQIFLTQMRRRTRKIALFKSIGATNIQAISILLWEIFYILSISLVIGVFGGFALVNLIIVMINKYTNSRIDLFINYKLTFFGLVVGILAVFIGAIIPIIMSGKVPLIGSFRKPQKRTTSMKEKLKIKKNKGKEKTQNFFNIALRHEKLNKNKHLLNIALYTIAITVLLAGIFISFIFFQEYIDKVILTNQPDYELELDYALRNTDLPDFTEDIEAIKGIEDYQTLNFARDALLWYRGINDNQVLSKYKEIVPTYMLEENFGDPEAELDEKEVNVSIIRDAVKTNVYGVSIEDEIFNEFKSSLDEGQIREEDFKKGKEVVVMMPLYNINEDVAPEFTSKDFNFVESTPKDKRINSVFNYKDIGDITYDFRKQNYYERDKSLSVGENISLSIPVEMYSQVETEDDLVYHNSKVAGIIYYFPGQGIWPFSSTSEYPVVVGSKKFLETLYPASRIGFYNLNIHDVRDMIKSGSTPTMYGRTYVNIYTDKDEDSVVLDTNIQRLAKKYDFRVRNLTENNRIIFNKAFKFTLITLSLALLIAFILIIILYNTALSKIEQERNWIGILQSLGVSNKSLKKLYLTTGLAYAFISIILGNILLSLAYVFTGVRIISYKGLSLGKYLYEIFNHNLWLYPWKVHFIISLVFFFIITITYYIPIRKTLKNQPVYNIQSLNR